MSINNSIIHFDIDKDFVHLEVRESVTELQNGSL